MKFQLPGIEQTAQFARQLAGELKAGDLIILSGELGAGKTTFTQTLGEALGVRPGIISPTFVLVRIHPSLIGGPDLVHVDAYRLGSAAEIDDIDLENTLDSSVTVVEWGEGRVEHLSDSYLLIRLERPSESPEAAGDEDSEPRSLELTAVGPRWADLEAGSFEADLGQQH
ncbi:tRNA (adenosine(37)-N6)-threonylcarbamoyltransferase complex ATPase subunit type 1 TsaE [Psychromicrobium sp. YIM B11713]|uniref:tRNA (adenosine(37)-N6)-threonylcarbamoyltransferase complex ATPase subunit type 1 TsaE n=1 Tax=Psychromicrobium sp. YIM B11713 TaxID=3145233 RepID=UPI00374EA732